MTVLRIAELEIASERAPLHALSLTVEAGEVVGVVGDPGGGTEVLGAALLGRLRAGEQIVSGAIELITPASTIALHRRTPRGLRAVHDEIGELGAGTPPSVVAIACDPGFAAPPGERAWWYGRARSASEQGAGVLLLTPDIQAAVQHCARIAIVFAGRLVELADAAELAEGPEHPVTAELLANRVAIGGQRDLGRDRAPRPPPERAARGCAFHRRCAFTREQCRAVVPPLVEAAPDHLSACVLAPWQPGRLLAAPGLRGPR